MNRIEIVAVFTAPKKLCEKKDIESIEQIVDATLDAAVLSEKNEKGAK